MILLFLRPLAEPLRDYYLVWKACQNIFFNVPGVGYFFVLMGLAQKMNDISEVNK